MHRNTSAKQVQSIPASMQGLMDQQRQIRRRPCQRAATVMALPQGRAAEYCGRIQSEFVGRRLPQCRGAGAGAGLSLACYSRERRLQSVAHMMQPVPVSR
jgi:hypothetical protein